MTVSAYNTSIMGWRQANHESSLASQHRLCFRFRERLHLKSITCREIKEDTNVVLCLFAYPCTPIHVPHIYIIHTQPTTPITNIHMKIIKQNTATSVKLSINADTDQSQYCKYTGIQKLMTWGWENITTNTVALLQPQGLDSIPRTHIKAKHGGACF